MTYLLFVSAVSVGWTLVFLWSTLTIAMTIGGLGPLSVYMVAILVLNAALLFYFAPRLYVWSSEILGIGRESPGE